MLRPYELAIALRYVRSRNKNRFISFISVISMAGIALAVAVLIMVLSVMNGFESEVRNRILQIVAHGSITGLDGRISDWQSLATVAAQDPDVRSVARFVDGQAMLVGPVEIRGVQVRGVDPVSELKTSALGTLMVDGALEALEPGGFGMVIGRTLAEQLGVKVGDSVIMLVSQGITTPAGVVPRMRRFRVQGIFYAGMYEFDRALVFINVGDAQRLFRFGDDVSGVRLAIRDPLQAPAVVRSVANAWGGGVYVTDWTREHGNFFRSIQLTRSIIFVILLLVVGVAAFNIVSTLVMVVQDKRGEIAILRTLGAAPAGILAIFVLQGAVVGVVGTLVGVVAGVLGAWNVSAISAFIESIIGFQFLAPDVYFISELPSSLLWSDVWRVAGIALVLGLVSTIYPAWRGAMTAPAEVLRYE
ncbi:MAG: lipoprotein-releasing ABC transporter permease subunit [Chromatiales bacterium]|jgi:lipoprotein-releasing system permease protein|nr:MAG: lipoprotein-releasing ABC transporter permease subunit [Chromatiales bacterium]